MNNKDAVEAEAEDEVVEDRLSEINIWMLIFYLIGVAGGVALCIIVEVW